MTDVNITIIGAGVVGLAVAARLSSHQGDVFVIEKHRRFGQEVSSRNSEVIHSGLYYPEDSLKARLCVRGKKMLYALCDEADIAHRRCGKLIVANRPEEMTELDKLLRKGYQNGVTDLTIIGQEEVAAMEPHISALAALYSPSTGIIDSHGLMKHLEDTSRDQGVEMVYGTEVVALSHFNEGYRLDLKEQTGERFSFTSRKIINCAGLESGRIAYMAGINDQDYHIHFCKGEYFRVQAPKNRLVSRLIYPVPGRKLVGLGIHSTVDLSGGLKLGPSAFYLAENTYDYTINEDNSKLFYESAKAFLPFLEPDDLTPDIARIRPKIQAPGDPVKDFIIREESDRGFPGLINCIGIESPGLTSSLAIAAYVEEIMNS